MGSKVYSLKFIQIKWLLIGSYFISFIFDTMIDLSFSLHFIPSFTVLLLFFWSSQLLNQTHLFTAFILGVITDVAMNTPLGSHALIYIILVFFMLRTRIGFESTPMWQQAVIIGFYLTVAQGLNWLLLQPSLTSDNIYSFWLSPWIAAIIWPFLYNGMLSLTHRSMFK